MKTKLEPQLIALVLLLTLTFRPSTTLAQSTAFTYNGRLNFNGAPVSGSYEMQFTLFDADVGVGVVKDLPGAIPVDVVNGLFTTRIDFGDGVFTGPARWLEVKVRPAGAADYMTLTPSAGGHFLAILNPGANRRQRGEQQRGGEPVEHRRRRARVRRRFLSYNGGNLVWTDPAVAAGNIWSLNGLATYYNAGKVGIGTTGPLTPLEVNGVLRSTRSNLAVQYLQLDGGDPNAIRLTAQSAVSAEKTLLIQNFSSEVTPGVNNSIQFVVGKSNAPSSRMTLTKDGNLILPLAGSGGSLAFGTPNFETGMTFGGPNRADIRFDGSTLKLLAGAGSGIPAWTSGIIINTAGNVGIGGSSAPVAKLEVVAQDALRLIGYQPFLTVLDSNAGYARGRIQGVGGDMVLEPESFVNGGDGNAYAKLFNSGNFSVKTLTIRGGADLAEPFQLSAPDIAKGSVVVIDEAHPGQLKLSTEAYDKRVAGIISGANGINPGIALHQEGTLEGGQNVALSGRVYVQADASFGAIKPGDLLTTSDTPGHAMRYSDHSRAQGATLGKAMSGLNEGKGMVLVLVTLQ